MFIEDLRNEDMGMTYLNLWAPNDNKWLQTIIYYPEYINYAFTLFNRVLSKLENSRLRLHSLDSDIHNCLFTIFLGLESYLTTILRIVCILDETNFDKKVKAPLYTRLKYICSYFGIPLAYFNTNNLLERLNEFRNFRNELLHDRQFGKSLDFSYTQFSPIAPLLSISDLVEAFKILVETINVFRFIIKNKDIMPSVLLYFENKNYYRRIDYVYEIFLSPTFQSILTKHKLETKVNCNISYIIPFRSKKTVKANFMLRSDSRFDFKPNISKTNSGVHNYQKCAENFKFPDKEYFIATPHCERIYSDY